MDNAKTGVLLVNLGSPTAPTAPAVRRFLKAFLGDPRVVNLPRPLWWLILNGLVLPFRAGKSAQAYRQIWTKQGSPLAFFTRQLADKLAASLQDRGIAVSHAMSYGEPAIARQLQAFKAQGIERYIVLPLYPQYSSTTTASVYDQVAAEFKRWRHIPSFTFISDYHKHPAYIAAVADSIRAAWRQQGKNALLLLSFHGLPEQLTAWGDPYYRQCQRTAALLAEALELNDRDWQLVFQSRFGKAEWLKPYCVDTLQALPERGIKTVDIACPGFAVDCLETLEEIAIANKAVFLNAGGNDYRYIPALNNSDAQVAAIARLLAQTA